MWWRKKKVIPPAERLPIATENVIGALLDTVEREVLRERRVTARDVLEGRQRSDSFYDAETEKLPRPPPPLLTPTPTGSLSPFVVNEVVRKRHAPPKRTPPRASGVPSGPWAFALILLGGVAAFLVFVIGFEPRSTPAHAPSVASDLVPSAHDAGARPRSSALPAPSPR